jgi:hypothetical protein
MPDYLARAGVGKDGRAPTREILPSSCRIEPGYRNSTLRKCIEQAPATTLLAGVCSVPPEHDGPRLSTHPVVRRRKSAEIPGHGQKLLRPLKFPTAVRVLQPQTGLNRVSGRLQANSYRFVAATEPPQGQRVGPPLPLLPRLAVGRTDRNLVN